MIEFQNLQEFISERLILEILNSKTPMTINVEEIQINQVVHMNRVHEYQLLEFHFTDYGDQWMSLFKLEHPV